MENLSSTTSSSSSMQFLILEQVQFVKVNNDDSLLQWELVDVVEAEEEQEQEEEQTVDVDDHVISWSVSSRIDDPIERINHPVLHLDAYVEDHNHDYGVYREEQVNHDIDDDDDDEEDDGDDDLDDELVPWNIGNKLGRQRMRKLGKRVSSKMNNSKKSPYLFVSPGCVRGKHGMGLKHCSKQAAQVKLEMSSSGRVKVADLVDLNGSWKWNVLCSWLPLDIIAKMKSLLAPCKDGDLDECVGFVAHNMDMTVITIYMQLCNFQPHEEGDIKLEYYMEVE
ncbi:hypothetical protein L195_g030383, partial [Trifolium pratense]